MKSIYEAVLWVSDEDGKRYVCNFDEEVDEHIDRYEQLSDEEREHCRPDQEFPWN